MKSVSSHYERALNPLRNNLIIFDTHYEWLNNKCRSYIINPELFEGDPVPVTFKGIRKKSDRSTECRSTVRFMRDLRLDVRMAKAITNEHIESGRFMDKIIIDPDLETNYPIKCRITGETSPRFMTVAMWKDKAEKNGLKLIQDGNEYILDDPQSFVIRKVAQIKTSYYDMIHRFQNREFHASRNETNNRLDSNLTVFPGILMGSFKYGRHKESLISLDLSNSQFVILAKLIQDGTLDAYILQSSIPDISYTSRSYSIRSVNTITISHDHVVSLPLICHENTYNCALNVGNEEVHDHEIPVITDDLTLFVELAKNGKIYEFMQYSLGLPIGKDGRSQAKKMAFGVFFSGVGIRGAKKDMLKVFPSVVKLTENYKRRHGNESFAVLLQKSESRIFVDRIKKELDSLGYDTATKHDSVLMPASQMDEVEKVIRRILDEELGSYELKLEVL